MQRAPWAVGLLFGVSLAVLITLLGPLLLFNPWFTSSLQEAHGVAPAFGTTQPEINRVTGEILVDLYTDGPFEASLSGGEPLLNDRERSHMHDVSVLVRILFSITVLALIVATITGLWLRREPHRVGWIMVLTGGVIGALAILVAAVFAVAFEPAFLFFHELFFPPGTYLFEPGSRLITLFPEGFWFDASLSAGATIIVTALAAVIGGIVLWRRSPPDRPLRPA